MKYIYPAIFTEEANGILVDFPDLRSCYTDGATMEEAFENAEDALALALWHLEETQATIPLPSAPKSLTVPSSSSVALIKADTLPVRKLNDTRTVRKNVSLPAWLDALAREHDINCSKLLQSAIRKECGVDA